MDDRSALGRVKNYFAKSDSEDYEPLAAGNDGLDEDVRRPILVVPDGDYEDDLGMGDEDEESTGEPFSWLEYSIFLLLGVVMLWAW
jgi:equilibrative nucleoside transporter 1/2/3